jgi:ribosomal protein S18 acetylase RimI-like enzyme
VFRPRLDWTTLEAWIPDLYVDPGFRRRGAARALLDACVEEARERKCHRLVLESGHERTEAHQLYEAYGFVHSGRAYGLVL